MQQLNNELEDVMRKVLTEEEYELLSLRYGINRESKGMSVVKMAKEMSMSRNGMAGKLKNITIGLLEFMLAKGIKSIDDLSDYS